MIEVYLFPIWHFQHVDTDSLRKYQCKNMWEQNKNVERMTYNLSAFEEIKEIEGYKSRSFIGCQ